MLKVISPETQFFLFIVKFKKLGFSAPLAIYWLCYFHYN